MLVVEADARITGLRIDGLQWDWVEYQDSSALAIDVLGNGVEIDNVEAYGWGYAAIRTDDDTHIHHNHVHRNSEDRLDWRRRRHVPRRRRGAGVRCRRGPDHLSERRANRRLDRPGRP